MPPVGSRRRAREALGEVVKVGRFPEHVEVVEGEGCVRGVLLPSSQCLVGSGGVAGPNAVPVRL